MKHNNGERRGAKRKPETRDKWNMAFARVKSLMVNHNMQISEACALIPCGITQLREAVTRSQRDELDQLSKNGAYSELATME